MKLKSLVAFVAAAFLLALVAGGQVSAHAELDRSVPKANETVKDAPKLVEIWFTEEIARIDDPSGRLIRLDPETLYTNNVSYFLTGPALAWTDGMPLS